MKPLRTTLFVLLFLYLALLVGVAMNFNNANDWMLNHPLYLSYISIAGMIIFVLLLMINVLERSSYHRKIHKQEAEKNEIKARVYEMQRKNDEIEQSMRSFENSVVKKDPPKNYPNANPDL